MSSDEYKLKVSEAKYRDVGKGIAHIPKRVMRQLSINSGDVIEIEGKSKLKTSVIAWPAYDPDENADSILIDRITRSNAGTHLDDFITVRKAKTVVATSISLASVSKNTLGTACCYLPLLCLCDISVIGG